MFCFILSHFGGFGAIGEIKSLKPGPYGGRSNPGESVRRDPISAIAVIGNGAVGMDQATHPIEAAQPPLKRIFEAKLALR